MTVSNQNKRNTEKTQSLWTHSSDFCVCSLHDWKQKENVEEGQIKEKVSQALGQKTTKLFLMIIEEIISHR